MANQKKPLDSSLVWITTLFHQIIPKEKLWQYSRLWQWFFSFPQYARLLIRDGFKGKLDTIVDLDRLIVANPDKQDALGKHRIEDLNCVVPLILSDEQIAFAQEKLKRLGIKNARLPTQAHITLFCEHKYNMGYDIYRQGFEQYAAEIVEKLNLAHRDRSFFPLLEPVLVLFCVHGLLHFPMFLNLSELFLQTGDSWLDSTIPSIPFEWFNLNNLDSSRFFDGTNPVEYDGVLNMLQGADKPDLKNRLITSLDNMEPFSDNPMVTQCADKLLLFASSSANRLNPVELNEIACNFHPRTGADNMESRTVLERMAIMFAEQGIEQGIEQGKAKGKAELIINLLNRRFGLVCDDIKKALFHIQDEPVLDSYFNIAYDCQSLEEFKNNLL